MSAREFVREKEKPIIGELSGYKSHRLNASVDDRLSLKEKASRMCRDDKQHFLSTAIQIKKYVPAPNIYEPQREKSNEHTRRIFMFDRVTHTDQLMRDTVRSGINTDPFTYKPLDTTRIKCHLKSSSQRYSITDNASALGKQTPGPRYNIPSLVSPKYFFFLSFVTILINKFGRI